MRLGSRRKMGYGKGSPDGVIWFPPCSCFFLPRSFFSLALSWHTPAWLGCFPFFTGFPVLGCGHLHLAPPIACEAFLTVPTRQNLNKDHFKSQGSKSQATVKCLNVHVFIAFIYLLTAQGHEWAAQRMICRTQLSSFSWGIMRKKN